MGKTVFTQPEQEKLLEKLGEARRDLIRYQESLEFRSVGRGAVDTVVKNLMAWHIS